HRRRVGGACSSRGVRSPSLWSTSRDRTTACTPAGSSSSSQRASLSAAVRTLMLRHMSRALAGLLLATVASAQTFVVDQANGPGTNFTTLVAAVAAVPDGAVLLVRPGTYAGFAISQKGLLVLADPGVTLSSDVTVSNTAPQQQTLLRGFVWTSNNVVSGPAFLRLASCQGAVAVEAMSTPTPNFACAGAVFPCPKAVYATACAALMFRSCT